MAPGTVPELLNTIEEARDRLEALLRILSEDQLVAPMLENGWSVKDTLAHVSFWEYRMRYGVSQETTTSNPAVPPEIADIEEDDAWVDAVNERIYEQNRERPLADIRAEAASSFAETLALVGELSEDDLFRTGGLSQRIKRNPLALIADNTYEHYDEHSAAIERAFPTSA